MIKDILEKKLLSNTLHHLIVLHSSRNGEQAAKSLLKQVSQIIESFFKAKSVSAKLENNPDVLIITKEEKKNQYDGEIIGQIAKFLSHKALNQKKFIIFDDIQFLSEIHCNKLLKFFEEPPIDCQYFLLNPQNVKLLSTINSRSISFSLSVGAEKTKNTLESLVEKIKDKDLSAFCDYLKTRQDFELNLISAIIDSKDLNGKQLLSAQNYANEFFIDKQYNNTPYMRHTILYGLLQETVLN